MGLRRLMRSSAARRLSASGGVRTNWWPGRRRYNGLVGRPCSVRGIEPWRAARRTRRVVAVAAPGMGVVARRLCDDAGMDLLLVGLLLTAAALIQGRYASVGVLRWRLCLIPLPRWLGLACLALRMARSPST